MAESSDPAQRLLKLADDVAPELRSAFLELVDAIEVEYTQAQIEMILEQGAEDEVVSFFEAAAAVLAAAWALAFRLSAQEAARVVAKEVGAASQFNEFDPESVSRMAEQALRLQQQFALRQLETSRAALDSSAARGETGKKRAAAWLASLGLSLSQQKALDTYRELLETGSKQALERELRDPRFDAAVRRAALGGRPLSEVEIERMVKGYRTRLLAHRAEVLAQTEALAAVHAGADELFRQSLAAGLIADVRYTWRTMLDARVRDSHSAMEGQVQPHGQPFTTGRGNHMRYPGDPAAPAEDRIGDRCALETTYLVP